MIAEESSPNVSCSALVVNKLRGGVLNVCAVKAPALADRRNAMMATWP